MIQIFCSPTLLAQKIGELGYQYPILQEEDFKVFLEVFEMPEDVEYATFLKAKNMTEEHFEAAISKITINVVSELLGASEDDMIRELGPSAIFNKEEKHIYAKYKDRLLTTLHDEELLE
jgi:hypothetical protein